MTDNLPSLLTEDTPEADWAKEDPKGIPARVTRARQEGYVNLTPFQRQFAMEFVLSGTSLKKIARIMDLPLFTIRSMYNDPVVRAYIADFQKEIAAHRLINDQWVETQIMKNWPKLMGEEPVDIVTSKGTHTRQKKYHGPEIASILKHFSGQEQAEKGGNKPVQVNINFENLLSRPPNVIINAGDDNG